jgi:hypothetical protein
VISTQENQRKIKQVRQARFDGKNYELRHREGLTDNAEKEFYLGLCYLALSDFPDQYFIEQNLVENVNRFYATLEFLSLYCPDNKV